MTPTPRLVCQRCHRAPAGFRGWCRSCLPIVLALEAEKADIRRRIVQTKDLLKAPRSDQHRAQCEQRLAFLVNRQSVLQGERPEVDRVIPSAKDDERERRRERAVMLQATGMRREDIAASLGVSETTAARDIRDGWAKRTKST